jgi:hypothetical protein
MRGAEVGDRGSCIQSMLLSLAIPMILRTWNLLCHFWMELSTLEAFEDDEKLSLEFDLPMTRDVTRSTVNRSSILSIAGCVNT